MADPFFRARCIFGALKCEIRVVFVYYRNFTFPSFTTDLELTSEQMIEYYAARWKIESGFKEIKHEISANDSQMPQSIVC